MKLTVTPHIKKSLKISIVVEIILASISGYVLYSHPEHSSIFLAAFFQLPGSMIGLYFMEFLKPNIASYNTLFTICAAISILFQVLILTWFVSIFQNEKQKRL